MNLVKRQRRWRTVLALCFAAAMVTASHSQVQAPLYERTFAQSKATVEKALKGLQPSASGRLPVLDGFTQPGHVWLERYRRGYYQCSARVTSTAEGGSVVRVSAKITAWYSDSDSSKSGYQVLPSNGRLETDFLDRLEETLGGNAASADTTTEPPALSQLKDKRAASSAGTASKLKHPAGMDAVTSPATQAAVAEKHKEELTKEAKDLEEILRNQAAPDNLVAVRKSGTPVLDSPIEGAKVLFLASAEDEFEVLDTNANWVHVRISGPSRGWLRRSSLEMPASSASAARAGTRSASVGPRHFEVQNEQTATFPGTWEPLQGKTVQILTVQEVNGSASDTGAKSKSDFAKSMFEKQYAELTQSSSTAAGVVLIFDSQDGGMVAATLPAIAQWKAGALSDQGFWRRCFLDPPEMFGAKPAE